MLFNYILPLYRHLFESLDGYHLRTSNYEAWHSMRHGILLIMPVKETNAIKLKDVNANKEFVCIAYL